MPRKPSSTDHVTFSVRLPKDLRERLDAFAVARGLESSQCIRWAVDAFLDYVEAHGGHVHLPIDFTVLWQKIEARQAEHSLAMAAETAGPTQQTAKQPVNYRQSRDRRTAG